MAGVGAATGTATDHRTGADDRTLLLVGMFPVETTEAVVGTKKKFGFVGISVGKGDGTAGGEPQKQPFPHVWKNPHSGAVIGFPGQLELQGMKY